MKSNQGEFQQFVLAFLVLFLHDIPVFGASHEILCNRTCGSRTVKYPFGFSGACPYILDSDCSEYGDIYLKGFQVQNFTRSSIIIQPWQSKNNNKSNCYEDVQILSHFKKHFGLTSGNVLLLADNCTNYDCNINTRDLRRLGSKYRDGRENCSTNVSGLITCLSITDGHWLSWKYLEGSACKYILSSLISQKGAYNGSINFEVDKVEMGWWVNGTCRRNSCSVNAKCSQFQNPNNYNETVHRCHCNQGFEGDGYPEGFGCQIGTENAMVFWICF